MANFFDKIGVADMEKVHSAVIGWIFSDECQALNNKQKSELLCKLFGVTDKEFQTFKTETEFYNIDILIITDENTPDASCWVIENKIKSSQHSNQLEKYVDIVEGKEVEIGRSKVIINDFKDIANKKFCFLTLVDEKPQCENQDYNNKWTNSTYKKLADMLNAIVLKENVDAIILAEYKQCITNLADALSDFIQHYKDYTNVFTDGSKKKGQKALAFATNNYANYIATNGLETIFQKCFLQTIISQTCFKYYKYSISETHGTALVDFNPCPAINGTSLGIQFQNGSFKVGVCLIIDNNTQNKEQLVKDFWKKWKETLHGQILDSKWGNPNKSREEKLPYFSFSIKEKSAWYAKDMNDIIRHWNQMFDVCKKALDELARYC